MKCVHCGEFLDGREKEQKAIEAKAAQPTFIIEKAVIADPGRMIGMNPASPNAMEGVRLLGRKDQPALPAPVSSSLEDDEPLPYVGESEASLDQPLDVESVPTKSPLALPPPSGSHGGELIPRPANPPVAPQPLGGLIPPAMIEWLKQLLTKLFRKPEPEEPLTLSARSEEDNYRTCMMCQTEILTADNYCFHCGQQYAQKTFSWGSGTKKRKVEGKSNFFIYMMVVACWMTMIILPYVKMIKPETSKSLVMGCGIAAPLLALAAFARATGIVSRFIAFVYLALTAGLVYLQFFG